MEFRGYHPNVKVYNTGGWVVDTIPRQPLHGGAIVLADADLNLASVRMYNEAEDAGGYTVRVETITHSNDAPNPFYDHLKELVRPDKDP